MAKEILGTGEFRYQAADAGVAQVTRQIVKEFTNLATATGTASKAVVNFQKGTVNLATGIAATGSSMDKSAKSAKNFSTEMFQASLALGALTAGIAAVGKQMGDMAFQFDRNMTLVKAVTGATGKEFQNLSSQARDLGSETEFGATKAADGLLVLSRMGLTAAESMDVLSPSMKLAQSQQHDMTETTELLISQLRVFGKSTTEAGKFANVLAASSSRTAADLEKLGLSLSYVGPIAASTGRSFEEVNAVLGLMFNSGIKASRAGTSLRFAMAALLGTTAKSNKALKSIGLTIEDVSPTSNSFSKILKTLAGSLRGVEDRTAVLFDLFGKRAAPAMGAVIEQVIRNRGAFDELLGKITDTNEVTRQFETQMDSFSGKVLKARSNIQELVLSFTEGMMPALISIVDLFQSMVEWLSNLSTPVKTFITAIAAGGAAALALTSAIAGAVFIGSILSGTLVKMSTGAKAFATDVLKANASVMSLTASEKAATAALTTKLSATAQITLANKLKNKEVAKEIIATANLAASEKVLAKEKWEVFKASIKQQLAGNSVTKEYARQAIAAANLRAHHLGVSDAMKGNVAEMGVLSVVSGKLKLAFKGLWTAMGGWLGFAMIALPTVIALFSKMHSDIKKQQQDYLEASQEMIDANNELVKSTKDLADIRADMDKIENTDNPKKLKELAELQKEYSGKLDESSKIKGKLIELLPDILKGYNAETNSLEINNNLLDEEINKRERLIAVKNLESIEIKDGVQATLESVDAEEEQYKKIIELQDALQAYTGYLEDARDAREKAQASLKATENLPDVGDGTAQAIMIQEDINKVHEADVKVRSYSAALVILKNKYDQLSDVSTDVSDSNENINSTFDKLGDKTDKTIRSLDSLISTLKSLNGEINTLTEKSDIDFELINADSFSKEMAKIDSSFGKQINTLASKIDKARARLSSALKKIDKSGVLLDPNSVKEAQKLLDEAQNNFNTFAIAQSKTIDAMKDKMYTDYLSSIENISLKTQAVIESTNAAMESSLERRLAGEVKALKAKHKAEEDAILDTIRLRKLELDASNKKYGNNSIESKGNAENLKNAEVELHSTHMSNLDEEFQFETDGINKILELKTQGLNDQEIFQGNIIRNNIDMIDKKIDREKKGIDENAEHSSEALLMLQSEKIQAEKDLAEYQVQTFLYVASEAGKIFENAFEALGGVMSKEMEEMLGELKDAGSIIGKAASGDYVGAIVGLVGKMVEYSVGFFDEVIKTEKEQAEIENGLKKARLEQMEAQKELTIASDKLKREFIDFAEEVVSMSSSIKSSSEQVKEAAEKFSLAAGQFDIAAGFNIEDFYNKLEAAKGTGLGFNQDKQLNELLSKLLDPDALVPEIVTIDENGKATTGSSTQRGTSISSLTQVGELDKTLTEFISSITDKDKQQEVALAISEFFANRMLLDFRDNLYDPLLSISKDGEVTKEEFITSITAMRKSIEELDIPSGLAPDLKEALAADYKNILDLEFSKKLEMAQASGDTDSINKIFSDYKSGLLDIVNNYESISESTRQSIDDLLTQLPDKLSEALSDSYKAAGEGIEAAAEEVVNAYDAGTITYKSAMLQLNSLKASLSDLPEDLRKGFSDVIGDMQQAIVDGLSKKASDASAISEAVPEGIQSYLDDLDSINDKYSEIQDNWESLISDRQELLDQFDSESATMKSESEDRISALNAERDAVIGMFDFSETQNQRSNRFNDARKIEKSILDEIATTNENLIDLQDKHEAALESIDDKLVELQDEYGTLDGLTTAWQEARNDREQDFIDYLDSESDKLTEITGKVIDLAKAWNEAYDAAGNASAADQATSAITGITSSIADTAQAESTSAINSINNPGAFFNPGSQTGSAIGTSSDVQVSSPMFVGDEDKAKFSELLKSIRIAWNSATGNDAAYARIGSTTGENGEKIFSSPSFFDNDGKFISGLTRDDAANLGLNDSIDELLNMAKSINQPTTIKAQHGFEGIVRRPTGFSVGEGFRPEFVSVTPMKDMASMANGIGGGSVTNVYINDQLDFRGAYGITDKSVAEEVYRDVWAPARRKNLDRFFNTKGKVIQ